MMMSAFAAVMSVLGAGGDGALAAGIEIKNATVTAEISPWCMTFGFIHDPSFGPTDVSAGVKYTSVLLTPPQAVIAVNSGDVDVDECVAISSLTQAWIKGARNMVVVGVGSAKPIYALVANSRFRRLEDLRGGTVGSAGPQSIATQSAEMILKRGANLLAERDYSFISAGTGSARFAALLVGKIDALSMYPPFTYRLADDGFSILGYEADYVPDYVAGTLAVNRTWAERNRAAVVAMLKSMVRTAQWLKDPANKDKAIGSMAEAIRVGGKGIGQAYAARLYDDFIIKQALSFNGYANEERFTMAMNFMAERGFLEKKDYPLLSELVDFSYLNEALKELSLPQVKQFAKK
jgi:ABC-type nitrate/sulfonate/bicarbonate transport system substrate-binding protein